MLVNGRLRDQLAVLEGVRALYQSDMIDGGPGIRAYLAALSPQERATGMQGVGIAPAMQPGKPAPVEDRLRDNYAQVLRVWPQTQQAIGFPIIHLEHEHPLTHHPTRPDNSREHETHTAR